MYESMNKVILNVNEINPSSMSNAMTEIFKTLMELPRETFPYDELSRFCFFLGSVPRIKNKEEEDEEDEEE